MMLPNAGYERIRKGNSMSRDDNLVIERDSEGYFVAPVPGLPGCHTQARSLDVLMECIREAVELCLEVEQQDTTLAR
jgi:predicted RNase H-like HicB family nuclease